MRSWNSPGITWSYVLWCDTTNAWSWGRKLATESVNGARDSLRLRHREPEAFQRRQPFEELESWTAGSVKTLET